MHHTGHCRARAQAREAVRSHTGVPVSVYGPGSGAARERRDGRPALREAVAAVRAGSRSRGGSGTEGSTSGPERGGAGARGEAGGEGGGVCSSTALFIALPATLLLFFESSLICRRGVPFCHIISMLSFVTPYTAIFHLSTDDSVEGVYRYVSTLTRSQRGH